MFGRRLAAWTVAGVVPWAAPLAAQAPAQPTPPAGVVVTVEGLAVGDLLNVRAVAGPGGLVLDRLPNGALLRTRGCRDFNGYPWCEVEALDKPGRLGWAPARYLHATETDLAAAAPAGTDVALAKEAGGDPTAGGSLEGARDAALPAEDVRVPALPLPATASENPAIAPAAPKPWKVQVSGRAGGIAGPPPDQPEPAAPAEEVRAQPAAPESGLSEAAEPVTFGTTAPAPQTIAPDELPLPPAVAEPRPAEAPERPETAAEAPVPEPAARPDLATRMGWERAREARLPEVLAAAQDGSAEAEAGVGMEEPAGSGSQTLAPSGGDFGLPEVAQAAPAAPLELAPVPSAEAAAPPPPDPQPAGPTPAVTAAPVFSDGFLRYGAMAWLAAAAAALLFGIL